MAPEKRTPSTATMKAMLFLMSTLSFGMAMNSPGAPSVCRRQDRPCRAPRRNEVWCARYDRDGVPYGFREACLPKPNTDGYAQPNKPKNPRVWTKGRCQECGKQFITSPPLLPFPPRNMWLCLTVRYCIAFPFSAPGPPLFFRFQKNKNKNEKKWPEIQKTLKTMCIAPNCYMSQIMERVREDAQ